MALLDDLTKVATPGNLLLGVGAALLAPVLAPAVSSVLRPAAKAVMRTGIALYRGTVEPVSAAVGNLVTEAQMEMAAALGGQTQAAAPAPIAAEPQPSRPHKRRGDAPH